MTTEALADACSHHRGEAGSVKTATLNGIFAGKRKTLSTAEIEMFAAVLDVPLLDLLYPVGEEIEDHPGHFVSSADAVASAVIGDERLPGASPRTAAIIDIARLTGELLLDIATISSAVRNAGGASELAERELATSPSPRTLHTANLTRYRANRLTDLIAEHQRRWKEEPPSAPPIVQALLDFEAIESNTAEEDPWSRVARIASIADQFAAEVSNGQHQEAH